MRADTQSSIAADDAQVPEGIRVLLADDHAMVRDGLQRILETEPDIRVVAQVGDGAAVLREIEHSPCNLLLMDMAMPQPRGVELIQAVRAIRPDVPIMVVSMYDQPGVIGAAIRAGAKGYLTKGADLHTLISAVRQVAGGGLWLDPDLAQSLMLEPSRDAAPHERLTPREQQVFSRLLAGQSNQQMASDLKLSEKTISTHKINVLHKFGVTGIAGLVQYAQDHFLSGTFEQDGQTFK